MPSKHERWIGVPDSKLLVSAAHDGSVYLWNRETGQGRTLEATVRAARAVCWNPAGNRFFVAGAGGDAVQVFDSNGQLQWTSSGGYLAITAACWIDNETVLAAGRAGALYKVTADARPETLFQRRDDNGVSLDVNPVDGRIVMGGRHSQISIWDPADGRRLQNLNGQHGDVRAVHWHPDGKLLATAGWNGKARMWRDLEGPLFDDVQGDDQCNLAAWDPNGQHLAVINHRGRVKVFDLTGKVIDSWDSGCISPRGLCWNASGATLAVTGSGPYLMTRTLAQAKGRKFNLPRGGGVLSWSHDGQWWAVSQGSEVHVWACRH